MSEHLTNFLKILFSDLNKKTSKKVLCWQTTSLTSKISENKVQLNQAEWLKILQTKQREHT